MSTEKTLVITKGKEFKITKKDTIEETDVFYDQYVAAAKMLDNMLEYSESQVNDSFEIEMENNIIAFCGERGEGKSSAMMTFINVLSQNAKTRQNTIFATCKNIEKIEFSKPIVIDPSMFDNVHNILDIVVAIIYRKFKDRYYSGNENIEDYKREQLLNKFQKVYKSISLINDQKRILETEFDYEGNIENINRLGDSTRLKEDFRQLIDAYLDCMMNVDRPKKLLIAIDDLDLCNSNAYRMSEQIRKYLIIPNVVIVMAIKIEQLQKCVQEENFRNYSNTICAVKESFQLLEDVKNMSERYIAKLIPKARRVYLPNVHSLHNTRIVYEDVQGKKIYTNKLSDYDSIVESLLNLISIKTGMIFLKNRINSSYLLPDNLRDTVNFITLLNDMKDPVDDGEYYINIKKFKDYYVKEWMPQLLNESDYTEVKDLIDIPYRDLHAETTYILRERFEESKKRNIIQQSNINMEKRNCLFYVLNLIYHSEKNAYDKNLSKISYVFSVLYTIRLCELYRSGDYNELSDFIGGYEWGEHFDKILPNLNIAGKNICRSRFSLNTDRIYNIIAQQMGYNIELVLKNLNYISKIQENDECREAKIICWMLTGLLTNKYENLSGKVKYTYKQGTIISLNYKVINNLHICLENYIIGLCNLKRVYEKTNMAILGVRKNEFEEMIDKIEKDNIDLIDAFRKIVSNIDISIQFLQFFDNNKIEIKDGGVKTEWEKTKNVVDLFFKRLNEFYKMYINNSKSIDFNKLVIENKEGQRKVLDISELYANLMDAHIKKYVNDEKENDRWPINHEFMSRKQDEMEKIDKLEGEYFDFDVRYSKVASYLVTRTAGKAKYHLDNLIGNINVYYMQHFEEYIANLDIEPLRRFYEKIIDIYLENPDVELSDGLCDEYKSIVKLYNKFQ